LAQLVVHAGANSRLIVEGQSAIVGRDDNVDFPLSNAKVSRHHVSIEHVEGRWVASDLSSSNGTFYRGKRIDTLTISAKTVLLLGGEKGVEIRLELVEGDSSSGPRDSIAKLPAELGRISLGSRTRMGRGASNDLRIDDMLLSLWHAEIVINKQGLHEVVDLDSANGTFVNSVRVKRHVLQIGDLVEFGKSSLVFTGSALEPGDSLDGYGLVASQMSVVIGGKKLLDNVSFELKPSSVTAVIGPSGAGKSTVLNALTGKLPLSGGQVLFGSKDLIRDYDQLKSKIGFVPQSDLIHSNLTTQQALNYGAALRFPKDTTKQEQHARVERVLVELGLEHRKDLRIEKLSGGQRKRASVALELLTEPVLLFLDEPTSGLDPGLDRQVMQLLRDLADKGKTVVIVTHSTINLDLADDIVIMAPGGKLAYFGAPSAVMKTFKANSWPEVFDHLTSDEVDIADRSQAKFFGFKPNRAQETQLANTPLQGWFKQFLVLSKRYLSVIAADRGYTMFLGLLPFALSAVGLLTGSKFGLGEGSENLRNLNPDARSILLILLLGTTFIGASSSIQEIVRERVIFLRERSVGLRVSAYIASKIAVLGMIVTLQVLIFAGITIGSRPSPSEGLLIQSGFAELLVALVLVGICSMVIGLVVSALVSTSEMTMPILVVLTMVQIVFSGAVPLGLDGILEKVGFLIPAYWAMNMLSSTVDMNRLNYLNSNDYIKVWEHDLGTLLQAFAGLAISIVLSAIATFLAMRLKRNR
jgi:ABC-type multidrug transport system ATPase subunit/pSer/pThr/pTyr-binding forkhead associated (FHA) protein